MLHAMTISTVQYKSTVRIRTMCNTLMGSKDIGFDWLVNFLCHNYVDSVSIKLKAK